MLVGSPEERSAALDVLRKVLESDPANADALTLSERLLVSDDAAASTRREMLDLLRKTFMRSQRPLDVARVVVRSCPSRRATSASS